MRNVLHLVETTGPGGAETVCLDVASGLDRSRWTSTLAVADRGWVHDEARRRGVETTVVPTSGSFDAGYVRRLAAEVRRRDIRLIHAHLLGASVYGGVVGKLCGVPVVSTFHGWPDVSTADRYRGVKFRIIANTARRVVFVSPALRDAFATMGGLAPDRMRVIPNGIRLSRFSPARNDLSRRELGVGPEDFLVGAIGNVRPAKAYDVLLNAAALLRQSGSHYRFVIVGEAHGVLADELAALQRTLRLETVLSFTGFREDIPAVLNALDLFVLTSASEGFSLATIQAMACGVPVVATRSGGPDGIISHGTTGMLVDVGSPDQVAREIERLRTDPALRASLASAGRKHIAERYTTEAMIAEYEALYDELTAR